MEFIKFLRQPGFLIDLTYIYILYFNKPMWSSRFVDRSHAEDDVARFNAILHEFQDIPDDLIIFFYLKDEMKCFINTKYIFECGKELHEKFDFKSFKERIDDADLLVKNLFKYYFTKELDCARTDRSYSTIVDQSIQESSYPDLIKYKLLAFFYNPERYLAELVNDLNIKNALLMKHYDDHLSQLVQLQEEFDYENFIDNLKQHPNMSCSMDENKTKLFSFSLFNKFYLNWTASENLFILGYDYKNALNTLFEERHTINMGQLARVLADENRLIILDYLNEDNVERSTSEIAKLLGLSLNATIYHLSMMEKCGIVMARSIGRTVYYWLNTEYVEQIIKKFQMYKKQLTKLATKNIKGVL